LGLLLLLSGALADMAEDPTMVFVLGFMIILLMLVPSSIGTALGMSALRKGANPISVWIALVWNALALAALAGLILIGNFSE
jgi:hypothetical protein